MKLWCWYRTLHRYLLPKREMSKFSPSHLEEFINTTQIGKSFACQFREYNMRIWSLPNLNMDLEPNLLKPIWTTINFFPRGKCIPVITGQRLLDRQESEGRMDGFRCQAIYYSSQTKSDLVFIFSTQNIADFFALVWNEHDFRFAKT